MLRKKSDFNTFPRYGNCIETLTTRGNWILFVKKGLCSGLGYIPYKLKDKRAYSVINERLETYGCGFYCMDITIWNELQNFGWGNE